MSLLKLIGEARDAAGELGDDCAIDGCPGGRDEVVRLIAFDPIDHGDSFVPLCEFHVEWAEERNALAREMQDELREARREVGQAHAERIREVRDPPDGELDEAVSLSVADDIATIVTAMTNVESSEVVEP